MRVYAHGFLPWNIGVSVEPGCALHVKKRIESDWKEKLRAPKGTDAFPDEIMAGIAAIPGVRSLHHTGPQSSLLIPLRMLRGLLPKSEVVFSAVLGTGPVAEGLSSRIADMGIVLSPSSTRTEGDSPLEFSIRDGRTESETLRLYPLSRKRYADATPMPDPLPDLFLTNRCNVGISRLARAVKEAGGTVCLRPREFGKHDSAQTLVQDLLPYAEQLVLSTRSGALRDVANALGLRVGGALRDMPLRALGDAVFRVMRSPSPVLLLTEYGSNTVVLLRPNQEPLIGGPDGCIDGNSSCAARLHGAAAALLRTSETPVDPISEFRNLLEKTFKGMHRHPWGYPGEETPHGAP